MLHQRVCLEKEQLIEERIVLKLRKELDFMRISQTIEKQNVVLIKTGVVNVINLVIDSYENFIEKKIVIVNQQYNCLRINFDKINKACNKTWLHAFFLSCRVQTRRCVLCRHDNVCRRRHMCRYFFCVHVQHGKLYCSRGSLQ